MNILLIGPRAAGKTTFGRLLSDRLARPFVDLDDVALMILGHSSITNAWQAQGERAWRDAETRAFLDIIAREDHVIALGGGAPMTNSIRERVQHERNAQRALVVHLKCNPDELSRRLRLAGDRPSLTGVEPANEVMQVLAQRDSTYRSLADMIQLTDEGSLQETAARLERSVRNWEMPGH